MSSIVKLPRITAVGLCLILGVTHNASFAFAFQRSTVVTHRSLGKAGLFRYRSDHNGSESTEGSHPEIERPEELTASLGKWEDELNDEIEKLVNEKISSDIAAMKHEMCVDLKGYIKEVTGKLDDKIHKNSMKIIDHEHKTWMEMRDKISFSYVTEMFKDFAFWYIFGLGFWVLVLGIVDMLIN